MMRQMDENMPPELRPHLEPFVMPPPPILTRQRTQQFIRFDETEHIIGQFEMRPNGLDAYTQEDYENIRRNGGWYVEELGIGLFPENEGFRLGEDILRNNNYDSEEDNNAYDSEEEYEQEDIPTDDDLSVSDLEVRPVVD